MLGQRTAINVPADHGEVDGPGKKGQVLQRWVNGGRNPGTLSDAERLHGEVVLNLDRERDAVRVLRKADVALYRAKTEGVSALCFFEVEMDRRIQERDQLERDLRAAIGSNALEVLYQPCVDLRSGGLTSFEAVTQWRHPQLGVLDAARFIPVAEEAGLISRVTDDLLGKAARDAATWDPGVTLSFGISPAQLKDRTFGLRLRTILADADLAPLRLELDIAESAVVANLDGAQDILGSIRETGVKIALKDFGTGYSSLYHLRNLKIDRIKIDRSLIQAMGVNPQSNAIVRALVGLGSGLGFAVTAEGVQTLQQQRLLNEQGCQEAQNVGLPLTAEGALALITPVAAPKAASPRP